jgi:(1->4)-alpha-D-glucan 1-alpha-D-glucosylmutase
VPDIYQGCEFWDLSLVDPDNRRPVDYPLRERAIADMRARVDRGETAALAGELLERWHDGAVKAYVTWRLLHLRREERETFASGGYRALQSTGPRGEHLVAFARNDIVVVVPRLARRLIEHMEAPPKLTFGSEQIHLGESATTRYVDRFTGATIDVTNATGGPTLAAASLFANFPVAVLVPERTLD